MLFFFFFNDTATTEIYTLSLHDALPISFRQLGVRHGHRRVRQGVRRVSGDGAPEMLDRDRKSTRLNSSHSQISYAVFCLKKKKEMNNYRPCSIRLLLSSTPRPQMERMSH